MREGRETDRREKWRGRVEGTRESGRESGKGERRMGKGGKERY